MDQATRDLVGWTGVLLSVLSIWAAIYRHHRRLVKLEKRLKIKRGDQ